MTDWVTEWLFVFAATEKMEIIEKLILYYYTFKIDVMECTNVFFLFCKMEIEMNVTTTKYNYISKYGIILVKALNEICI